MVDHHSCPRPIVAAWQYGAGRVLSSAMDGTWHWSLARQTEVNYHARYWGQWRLACG